MFVTQLNRDHLLHWTIDGVLSAEECQSLVERAEVLGPQLATIDFRAGPRIDTSIRNNERVTFDDHELAEQLFLRAKSRLPQALHGGLLHGINERMRCYRYRPGQRFGAHYDGSFVRNPEERSELTFMVYLNDDFSGGETSFLDLDCRIRPKRGMALVFQHAILHEGSEVQTGQKYVLRSDVMYKREGEGR